MKTDRIRELFLEFFKARRHEVVPSDSLVPVDDPTLLFTGAGMNQFKEKFLGRNITYKRAVTSQKCLRTADLENVGRTSGHHTFFEMLGNFSFGDYFKKDAILWAWEFLTRELDINNQRLWVSVYKDDEEAYGIWKEVVKVPAGKIAMLGEKENFWPSEAPTKGPNGPCGPCSEIFYDRGADVGCGRQGCSPACSCGRFVEIWNLVFTQFDRQADGVLKPLPNKNIDTGMGLERLASVMQGVKTNFEIDILKPVVDGVISQRVSGDVRAVDAESPVTDIERSEINAIADHTRAVVFAIADGVMPSNEERGYVVRKLIRRAVIHAQNIGIKKLFLYKLVPVVAGVMKAQYPELEARREDIAQVVKREEESFALVIETQVPKVKEVFAAGRNSASKALAQAAFSFYDTYGMPYEMLEEIAEGLGARIDKEEFEKFLESQRQRSRSKSKIKGEIFTETFAKKVEALKLKTEFLGYDMPHAEAKVLAVLEGGEVILDRTPFYGESGGQAGDWGRIETALGVMEVEDAKRIGQTIVHIGRILRGRIYEGETARAEIDETSRTKVMANHTATHLLHSALRKVLGEHVRQTGSLVDAKHLRFDFTHTKKMDPREIERVEEIVNGNITSGTAVKKEIMSRDEAARAGATALFGEKYGKMVRVITIGDISMELCGGTHVDNTSRIGLFKITAESSIASGVRRIEAMTGDAARKWIEKQAEAQSSKLKAQSSKDEEKRLMGKLIKEKIENLDSIIAGAKSSGSVKVIAATVDGLNIEGLRILSDKIRERERSVAVILSAVNEGRVSFVVSVTEDLVGSGIKASVIAKEMSAMIDGSGGGRDGFAQGGGKSYDKLAEAQEKTAASILKR